MDWEQARGGRKWQHVRLRGIVRDLEAKLLPEEFWNFDMARWLQVFKWVWMWSKRGLCVFYKNLIVGDSY